MREAKNAQFIQEGFWFWKRYVFQAGKHRGARGLRPEHFEQARATQQSQAVGVLVVH